LFEVDKKWVKMANGWVQVQQGFGDCQALGINFRKYSSPNKAKSKMSRTGLC
jgi:hypothetical protein